MIFRTPFRALIVAFLMGSVAALAGCELLPSAVNSEGKVPEKGTRMTADLWASYMPKYKAGMIITYAETTINADQSESVIEISKEILKVEGDVVTYRNTSVTSNGSASFELTMPANSKPDSDLNLTSEGAEDVTVPAGTFKGAAKFTGPNVGEGSTITYWFVPGKGHVKIFTHNPTKPGTGSWRSELKVFKD